MIQLQTQNEHQLEETLRKVKYGKYARGTAIEYHVGDYSDQVGATRLGKAVYGLRDVAHLVQVKLQDEPRKYSYQVRVN